MRYIMFSKHLQELDVPAAGRAIKELGFDGVELTVRPKGHIEPERVTEDLPRAVDDLRANLAAIVYPLTGSPLYFSLAALPGPKPDFHQPDAWPGLKK